MLKCPFMKEVNYFRGIREVVPIQLAEFSQEEFLDCIQENCSAWSTYGYCNLLHGK